MKPVLPFLPCRVGQSRRILELWRRSYQIETSQQLSSGKLQAGNQPGSPVGINFCKAWSNRKKRELYLRNREYQRKRYQKVMARRHPPVIPC